MKTKKEKNYSWGISLVQSFIIDILKNMFLSIRTKEKHKARSRIELFVFDRKKKFIYIYIS